MIFTNPDIRYLSYISHPNPNEYKGFKLIGTIKKRGNQVRMTFDNGEKQFLVTASSMEEAYIIAFDRADSIAD